MTPEEFEKIKQAEKEHLRKVRALKNTVRQLERQKKVSGAISEMTSAMEEKFDVHDDMVQRLAVDAALNEARLEIALEQSDEADQKKQLARDEEDLARLKARQVVGQMRRTKESENRSKGDSKHDSSTRHGSNRHGSGEGDVEQIRSEKQAKDFSHDVSSSSAKNRRTPLDSDSKSKAAGNRDDLPEKTIGRMKR